MNLAWKLRLKFFLKNLSIILIIYSLCRILFIWFHSDNLGAFLQISNIYYLLIGIRFDLSAILLLSSWWILLYLLPLNYPRWFNNTASSLFIGIHLFFIFVNLGDIQYSQFTGTRLNYNHILAVWPDLVRQADQFLINYWYFVFILMAAAIVLWRFYSPIRRHQHIGYLSYPLFAFLCLSFSVIGIRGGLQKKVLQPSHAFQYTSGLQGLYILNSSFTILKSKTYEKVAPIKDFVDWQDIQAHIPKRKWAFHPPREKVNVVVIILESFATEFWGLANGGKGYTPFLMS
tara:strand:- start:9685 stop:10548 length:864 start_codon:yes stop_codon:yes gene_type:complete